MWELEFEQVPSFAFDKLGQNLRSAVVKLSESRFMFDGHDQNDSLKR